MIENYMTVGRVVMLFIVLALKGFNITAMGAAHR